jgi:hypothetical protein
MTRFIVDAQLPPALEQIRHQSGWFNPPARRSGPCPRNLVIIRKTMPFRGQGPLLLAPTVRLCTGNTHHAELLALFAQLMPEILVALQRGDRLVEIT